MKIISVTVGQMGTNCYLACDEESSKCLIIDPGEEADFITTTILENRLSPQAIILTHGHYDHCLASLELKLNFNIPIYLHQKDLFLYEKAHQSAKHFSSLNSPKLLKVDKFLSDKDFIAFGDSTLQVIHTPGHTPGSICLYSAPNLFTGDTLFADGVGRTDLSYSSSKDLQRSLQSLSRLPKETFIYPGHGDYQVEISSYQNSQFPL
jgi:hydroxyacylglutathione hydrolase